MNIFLYKIGGEMGYRFIQNSGGHSLTWNEVYEAKYSILLYTLVISIVGVIVWFNVKRFYLKK